MVPIAALRGRRKTDDIAGLRFREHALERQRVVDPRKKFRHVNDEARSGRTGNSVLCLHLRRPADLLMKKSLKPVVHPGFTAVRDG
jgi:hypothetical protein